MKKAFDRTWKALSAIPAVVFLGVAILVLLAIGLIASLFVVPVVCGIENKAAWKFKEKKDGKNQCSTCGHDPDWTPVQIEPRRPKVVQ